MNNFPASSLHPIISSTELDQSVLVCSSVDENRWQWRLLRKQSERGKNPTIFSAFVRAGMRIESSDDGLHIVVADNARIGAPSVPFRLFEAGAGFLILVAARDLQNAYYYDESGKRAWRVAANPWSPPMSYAGVERIEDGFALVVDDAARWRYNYIVDLRNGEIIAERDRLTGRTVDVLSDGQPLRYRPQKHELPPTFSGDVAQGVWERPAAEAFNPSHYPTLFDSPTLTERTLLAPGTDSPLRMFLIPINELLDAGIRTAEQLKDRYALPLLPTTMYASRGYPAGTRFIIGTAAANDWGRGGGTMLFGTEPAELTGGAMPVAQALALIWDSTRDSDASQTAMIRIADRAWGTTDEILGTSSLGDKMLARVASHDEMQRYVLLANNLDAKASNTPPVTPAGPVDVDAIADVMAGTDPTPLFDLVTKPVQILEFASGYALCQWGRRDSYNVTFYDRSLRRQWVVGRDPWGYRRPIEYVESDARGRLVGWIADRYRRGYEIDLATGDIVALLDAETRQVLATAPSLG